MILPQNDIPIELNPHIKSWEELTTGSFLNFTIAEEGIILFERKKLLSDYFTKLRTQFQKMGVQKIRFKGGYFYDFLPTAKTLEVFLVMTNEDLATSYLHKSIVRRKGSCCRGCGT